MSVLVSIKSANFANWLLFEDIEDMPTCAAFYLTTAMLVWLLGVQVYNPDFRLLTMRYNYRIGWAQLVSYLCGAVGIGTWWLTGGTFVSVMWATLLSLVVAIVTEFILAKINSQSLAISALFRLLAVMTVAWLLLLCGNKVLIPFLAMGWYVRNTPMGAVHRKPFVLASHLRHRISPALCDEIVAVDIPASIPDFSHAGRQTSSHTDGVCYDVTDHGILPDTGVDVLPAVQELVDRVGRSGGGVIYFPRGRYLFNTSGEKRFLQINYSYITLEGELSPDGKPLAELVNCGNLAQGASNPWLSPFFITTGERLQPSNHFWGLQFRRWRPQQMQSDSMSDPGGDGSLLGPPVTTRVVASSEAGDDILHVEDATAVGRYILLGQYNTDGGAALLKDILGQSELRPEWTAAQRAGIEQAPSFQWLVEVKQVVDAHTLRLAQPLWRTCDVCHEPVVCNVDMLEHITVRNLKLGSRWNGLFRHHGHRRYYSVQQAQEMDYGWNALNLKRVAHSMVENVVIENYTNPLCVMDSRNVTVQDVVVRGHDGHQGIKVYSHACDNLFRRIRFYNHFADMMGGEGNAYGNVFTHIQYLNPCFKPVEYDFHGFAEAPFSPPCYNLFDNVLGFATIHSSGPLHTQPACGRGNVWWNCRLEGEPEGAPLLRQSYYQLGLTFRNRLGVWAEAFKRMMRNRQLSPSGMKSCLAEAWRNKREARLLSRAEYAQFYTDFYLYGIHTLADTSLAQEPVIHAEAWNRICSVASLYEAQLQMRQSVGGDDII